MDNDLRLKEIQNFSPAFLAVLAESYYHKLRGQHFPNNPALQLAMDDVARHITPTPEGILEMEKAVDGGGAKCYW